jgi:8-oxo-dGTP diphosphatase
MPPFEQPDGRFHAVLVACQRPLDGRWLLVRRAADGPAPGRVSFPSGGVKAGESQQQTIVRKMLDELNVPVRPLQHCWRWDDPQNPLTLFGWMAELIDDPRHADPLQVAEILWLTLEEASAHPDGFPTIRSFAESLSKSCTS